MKYLPLVIHSAKNKNHYDLIMNSWGKNHDVFFFSDYFNENFNVIKVSENTEYNFYAGKQINIFKKLPESFLDYDWYFFCDDDMFLNTRLLANCLHTFDPNYVYGEIINCWEEDSSLFYPKKEAGFLISNKVFKILKEKAQIFNVTCSDVCVGLNLRELGIPLLTDHRFHSKPPAYYNIPFNEIHRHISFYYINSMKEHNILKNICNLPLILWGDENKNFDLVNF